MASARLWKHLLEDLHPGLHIDLQAGAAGNRGLKGCAEIPDCLFVLVVLLVLENEGSIEDAAEDGDPNRFSAHAPGYVIAASVDS